MKVARLAKQTRVHRKLHSWISVSMVLFMLVMAITGILLAWKKQLKLLPKTQKSKVEQADQWIPVEEMARLGREFAQDSLGKSSEIDRIDIRPDKGIAKIVFKYHFTELQLDGFSGKVLSVAQRNSDLIEKIHDGSILDFLTNPDGEGFKISYSTLTGLALTILSLTGIFLWYNPRWIKHWKQKR